ncbi:MAG TPA: hypothetical protein VIS51_09400 [Solirubrobacterales bacterium]
MREASFKAGGAPLRGRRLALWLVPFALIFAFLLWETRGQTLYADEWYFFTHAAGFDPGWVLQPDQGNMVFGATLVYKLVLTVGGGHDHLWLRLAWIGLDLICSALFFVLMRKRVGDFAAYVPALVLAVFGASWEMFGGSLGINVLTSMAAGLGALIAFERDNRRGDVLGCALLTFSVIAHSTGLAILAGMIAAVLGRPDRLRRVWIVAIPLLVYAPWWLWARKFGQSSITPETLSSAPAAVVSLFASAAASMAGAFRFPGAQEPGTPDLVIIVNHEPGLMLGALLAVAVGWCLSRLRSFEWRFVPPFVTLAVYWASIALVSPAREPGTGRYQYASAIFILLIFAELWRGWRPSRWGVGAIAAIAVISIVPNVINLHYAATFVRHVSVQDRAKVAILDSLRDRIPADTIIEPFPGNIERDMTLPVGHYFKGADAFGSPGYELDELPTADPDARLAADQELVYLLDVHVESAESGPGGDCGVVPPGAIGTGGGIEAGPGGLAFKLPDRGKATLGVRRFGDDFYRLEEAIGGGWYRVPIATDDIQQPWYVAFESSTPVTVCP